VGVSALTQRLLLIDFENVQHVDLSPFDDSYGAIVFLGAGQNAPKASTNVRTGHRFKRVTFQKVLGSGKNALDFHIAFLLGRIFETAPKTVCFVVSRDKGFDPLIAHTNKIGLNCRRVSSFAELEGLVCGRCNKDVTIEHNGGRWCSNCGDFATPPDQRPKPRQASQFPSVSDSGKYRVGLACDWCFQPSAPCDGIFDDGEWMCSGCMTSAS
jgi:hypothetical protein